MVTREMLQEAAGISEEIILKSIENLPREPYQFSNRFEKKMDKLMRKVCHPVRYTVMRSAAAILVLAFFLLGMVFAISPDVRASVIKWVKDTFSSYTQYTNSEASKYDDVACEYNFREIPKGYFESDVVDAKDGKSYVYVNQVNGYLLHFTYLKGSRTQSLFVKTDLHSHIKAFVNGESADIYITESDTETNAIVWYIDEVDTMFCISGKVGQNELIALAESVVILHN